MPGGRERHKNNSFNRKCAQGNALRNLSCTVECDGIEEQFACSAFKATFLFMLQLSDLPGTQEVQLCCSLHSLMML